MTIDKYEDIIDSRDVIARIEELRGELDDEQVKGSERNELRAELIILEQLAQQGEGVADWTYGETLVRDSYFVEYAQQLAEDIGAVDSDAQWPLRHIDWQAAADELQTDYFDVDFDGVTYWLR